MTYVKKSCLAHRLTRNEASFLTFTTTFVAHDKYEQTIVNLTLASQILGILKPINDLLTLLQNQKRIENWPYALRLLDDAPDNSFYIDVKHCSPKEKSGKRKNKDLRWYIIYKHRCDIKNQ